MCRLLLLPDKPGSTKSTSKHKLLPLRERPVERVSARADACAMIDLLAALLGGPQPIETADALLAYFNDRLGDLRCSRSHEIADIPGIGQHNRPNQRFCEFRAASDAQARRESPDDLIANDRKVTKILGYN
jgi:DNA repair protein RadC